MQKQKLFDSEKFSVHRFIYQQSGSEFPHIQAAQDQLAEATNKLLVSTTAENNQFKAAQKKFDKAEQGLAEAQKLFGTGTEKKERSAEKCMQITRKFLGENKLAESGLKKYLGLSDDAKDDAVVGKLKDKQKELGFKGNDVDGVFGKKTFNAITTADKKDALTTLRGGAEKPLFTKEEIQKAEQALTAQAKKLLDAYAQLPNVDEYNSPESLQFLTDFYEKYTEAFAELAQYDRLIQSFDQSPAKIAITLQGNRTILLGVGNLQRDFKNVVLTPEQRQRSDKLIALAEKSRVGRRNLAEAGKRGRGSAYAKTEYPEATREHNLAVYQNQVDEWAKKLADASESDRTNVALELHKQIASYQSTLDSLGKTPDQFLAEVNGKKDQLIATKKAGGDDVTTG